MTGEGIDGIRQELVFESEAVQEQVMRLIEILSESFGSTDRVDGPNDTRLFTFAVRSKTTKRFNQYVAMTTNRHCNMIHPVERASFYIQVQTKDGEPGEGWYPGRFPDRGKNKEWWECNPASQRIDESIVNIVKRARRSMQG
jgi:hypothetical protein